MYWRGIPHFDPDKSAVTELLKKREAGENGFLPVLLEMVKYLAITAAIYLALAIALGAIRAGTIAS